MLSLGILFDVAQVQAKKDKRKLNTTVVCGQESNILKLIIFYIQKIYIILIQ